MFVDDASTLVDGNMPSADQGAVLRDGVLLWTCDQCQKTFTLRESLTRHMAVHRGETRCPVCDKVFSTKFNLQMHLRCTQLAAPQVWCNICHRVFNSQSTLRGHRAVHRGETTCPVCRKMFNTKGHMKRHLLASHPASPAAAAVSSSSAYPGSSGPPLI
ncbi:Zinc finger protein 816 [Amphibalanus amphitrite]|uniref:Zinc finger protein 816 n=1 Tax=Amphibalanus amphitrite TaxID=1232801 RepID=A0A6A4X284_AMPAM|nr:Zinc finger protein 816 [Amphibalanus amphitrite]